MIRISGTCLLLPASEEQTVNHTAVDCEANVAVMNCSTFCQHQLRVALQVLLTLPLAARQDYFPLLSEPLLMLEQLLMNLKVDWADVAVRTLRSLLVGQEAGFSSSDIDKLLETYASKALDFSCAPRERSRSGQCSSVVMSCSPLVHLGSSKSPITTGRLCTIHTCSDLVCLPWVIFRVSGINTFNAMKSVSDSVISLQEALMLCPAQDNSSQSSGRMDSPTPSAGESSPPSEVTPA